MARTTAQAEEWSARVKEWFDTASPEDFEIVADMYLLEADEWEEERNL